MKCMLHVAVKDKERAEKILQTEDLPEDVKEYLENVIVEGRRAEKLIQNLKGD